MDCTLTIPATIAKFSHAVLSTMLAAQIGVTGEVGISCSWKEGEKPPALPFECVAQVPEKTDCASLERVWRDYAPEEDDVEESKRLEKEAKLNDPVVKELVARIEELEKKTEIKPLK